jgi:CHAD domain-containing protein
MPTVDRGLTRTFTADDGFRLPPLSELLDGARADPAAGPLAEGDPVRQEVAATWFDTADLRLAAAGLTLRRTTGGDAPGWHVQVPAGSTLRSPVRLSLPGDARTVPVALRRLLWAQTLGAPLRPVAASTSDRTVRRLVDATGHVVVQVADDRTTTSAVRAGDGGQPRTDVPGREIEVSTGADTGDLLSAAARRLRDRGLADAPDAHGLAELLPVPRREHEQPAPTRATPAGDVLLAHLGEQIRQVRAQDLPVRLDAPDAVHKMRVATRRLRSALTTFKSLVDADEARRLRGELRWLAGELGAARDAEVMGARIRTAAEAAGADAGGAVEELGADYRTAHDRVLAELDGRRYQELLTSLDGLLTAPPLRPRAGRRAGKVLPRRVARSYDEVSTLLARADELPEGAEREELLHDARKSAKRARYAGESVAAVFGEPALAFAAAMEDVQEALGEHHDSVVVRERLRALAEHTSSTGAAFLFGRLHALEEARAEEFQRDLDRAWKAAGRKRLHRWLR